MMEIGGYLEFEQFEGEEYHKNALAINSGRHCLEYLIKSKNIRMIYMPVFICDSVLDICKRNSVEIRFYHVSEHFLPQFYKEIPTKEWVYVVNYYGQLDRQYIANLHNLFENLIVDNVQAFFEKPIEGVHTLYSCRKFLGVTDGAYLYTDDTGRYDLLDIDKSYERMTYVMGRYECDAKTFYGAHVLNDKNFSVEGVMRMSKLTRNILRGIDYHSIARKRTKNFEYLQEKLGECNKLEVHSTYGVYMYPLMLDNGDAVRKKLIESHIYIPQFWHNISLALGADLHEVELANKVLPLPVDQRYNEEHMKMLVNVIKGLL